MTDVTGVRYILPGMTIYTHVHLHDFIGVASKTVDPDRRSLCLLLNIPVALCALHLSHFYVSGMGEKNVVRLS